MGKVLAVRNLLIGVFIVSFSVTFIILSDSMRVPVNAEKTILSQTNTTDTVDRVAEEADISVDTDSKKISNVVISATNTSNTSVAVGDNEINATQPIATVPISSTLKSRPFQIRPKVVQDTEGRISKLPAQVSSMNTSIPSVGAGDSLSAKAISPESSPSRTDSPNENKLDPDDPVGSSNPRVDTNSIPDTSNQRASETDLTLTETRSPRWHIYEQRRLAICDQLISKWMKSGKSLYQLDRRTRLLITSSYACL